MHDLSNVVAQQRLIVENAARHKRNPEFVDDAIETIDNTVKRLSRLLEQLKTGEGGTQAARRTRLVDVARQAVARLQDRPPAPALAEADEDAFAMISGERLEHVLEHVIRNAQDATPADGSVRVAVRSDGSSAVIEVVDSGRGMDAEFVRDRLFRPFDTTKGAKGMGIGAFQTREFVRSCRRRRESVEQSRIGHRLYDTFTQMPVSVHG
jgi:signal transduction histidine kinase